MAVESAQQVEQAPEMPVKRWKFTVDDYYRMGELGIFPPDARVELVDGDVYEMPPIGSYHNDPVIGLNEVLSEALGRRVTLSIQGPLNLRPYGNPQPDVLVLTRRTDRYRHANPTSIDVLLLIEVADTTLAFDRGGKATMYAQAGISDYWIVDVANQQVLVHRDPRDGTYRDVQARTRKESLTPLAFPDISIAVADILG